MALGDLGKGAFKNVNTQGGALVKILNEFGQDITDKLRDSIEAKKVFSSGHLAQSIDYDVLFFGNSYVFRLRLLDYYEQVDKGQEAGKKVPVASILEWMSHKGIKGTISKKKEKTLKGLSNKKVKKGFEQVSSEKANLSMAIAIQKNIKKKGTIKRFNYEGSNFYSEVVTDSYLEMWKKKIAKAAKKDITMQIKVRE